MCKATWEAAASVYPLEVYRALNLLQAVLDRLQILASLLALILWHFS